MNITRGRIPRGQKVIIYGVEGIGKTTLASHFPGAVFIDTEGSTGNFDVARLDTPTSWTMLMQEAEWATTSDDVGTLIIDTADWAEKLCNLHVCQKAGKKGIEDFGYGKGYVYAKEEFQNLLNILDKLTQTGKNIVFTAHAQMRKVELPEEQGSYDKWEMKCSKYIAPMLKEWADIVLFCNYKTMISYTQDGKAKASGGKRMMYAAHHVCWDAKNRHGLPDSMEMDYSKIAALFPEKPAETAPAEEKTEYLYQTAEAVPDPLYINLATGENLLNGIPDQAVDLIKQAHVSLDDIRACVQARLPGTFPADMMPNQWPADFWNQWVIPYWSNVTDWITDNMDLPF